ncbi:hypothetical protein TNCT_372641 [Trichonephila clavata]|uniref:Uncharacterized protein n=1 Tax=Trichonephila clavata TaxID=2740835 RepID=A0A8X6H125_TRICU|nr:hypothetical protein TNCT_372641 [Trichonephila clavata]
MWKRVLTLHNESIEYPVPYGWWCYLNRSKPSHECNDQTFSGTHGHTGLKLVLNWSLRSSQSDTGLRVASYARRQILMRSILPET